MVTMVSGRQAVTMQAALAGRVLTIWAVLHSIHLILDGHVLRTVASRLLPQDPDVPGHARRPPGRTTPAAAVLPRRDGAPVLTAGQAIEVNRKVHRDGHVQLGGGQY
jgi:hypothetical protein